jgi:hypothetical protein
MSFTTRTRVAATLDRVDDLGETVNRAIDVVVLDWTRPLDDVLERRVERPLQRLLSRYLRSVARIDALNASCSFNRLEQGVHHQRSTMLLDAAAAIDPDRHEHLLDMARKADAQRAAGEPMRVRVGCVSDDELAALRRGETIR